MPENPVIVFARSVLHGTSKHQKWLMDAAVAFVEAEEAAIAEAEGADGKIELEAPESPRVFDIFTGQPFEGDGVGAVRPGLVEPDQNGITLLENALIVARAGGAIGFVVFAWSPGDEDFMSFVTLPPEELMSASALRYLGFTEHIRAELLDYSSVEEFFGDMVEVTQATPEMSE